MFRITPATTADLDQLNEMINHAYRGEEARKGWTHEADLIEGNLRTDRQSLENILKNQKGCLLTCRAEDNELMGCVYLEDQGHQLYLGMLTVNPQKQSMGAGKALLHAAEAFALEKGFSSIIMSVISQRKELIAWYNRNGYYPNGMTKPFPDEPRFGIPRQPLHFIVLEKKIGSMPNFEA